MGSPLTPALANLFLGHHENIWLENYNSSLAPLYYRRYVDDTFCLFNSEEEADQFFSLYKWLEFNRKLRLRHFKASSILLQVIMNGVLLQILFEFFESVTTIQYKFFLRVI